MTNTRLMELNLLGREIRNKKNDLKNFENHEPYITVSGYGKVCDLTPIEMQMIKTRL